MTSDTWLTETYFAWLADDCFSDRNERKEYEGVLRVLHDIPFYWTIWSDENRAGDALSYRQNDFLGFQQDLDRMDQHWLHNWGSASPTVLEVLLGMARRWTLYFEAPVPYYFQHFFKNMGFDRYPGKMLTSQGQQNIRIAVDDWMARQFEPNGKGSPLPLPDNVSFVNENQAQVDMRQVDIWTQMNAYSLYHFQ